MGLVTLKSISVIFSLVTLAAGAFIVYFTFTQFNGYNVLWEYINADAPTYGKIGFGSLGGIAILTGLIGIASVIRRNRCLLLLLNSLLVFLFLFCAGVVIIIIYFTSNYYDDLKGQNCLTAQGDFFWLQQSNNLYDQVGYKYFCTDFCECYVKDPAAFPVETFIGRKTQQIDSFPTSFQDCSIAKQETEYNSYIPLATFIEEQFSCSGICDPIPFFIFSNINAGPPENDNGCKTRIQDFYEKYSSIVKIVAYSAAGLFLCHIIFACWLCCAKRRSGKRSLFKRMLR